MERLVYFPTFVLTSEFSVAPKLGVTPRRAVLHSVQVSDRAVLILMNIFVGVAQVEVCM